MHQAETSLPEHVKLKVQEESTITVYVCMGLVRKTGKRTSTSQTHSLSISFNHRQHSCSIGVPLCSECLCLRLAGGGSGDCGELGELGGGEGELGNAGEGGGTWTNGSWAHA